MPCRPRKFKRGNPGDPCCAGCVHSRTFHVKGCAGMNLPGATVGLYFGTTLVGSAVTDSAGLATISGVPDGSYGILVTKPRFVNLAPGGAVLLSCPASSATLGPFTMSATSSYTCEWSTCADPVPRTLYLTTGLGTVTMNAQFAGGGVLTGYSGASGQAFSGDNCAGGTSPNEVSYSIYRKPSGEIMLVSSSYYFVCDYNPNCQCSTPCYGTAAWGDGSSVFTSGFPIDNEVSLGFDWCSLIDKEGTFAEFGTSDRFVQCYMGSFPTGDIHTYSIAWPVSDFILSES